MRYKAHISTNHHLPFLQRLFIILTVIGKRLFKRPVAVVSESSDHSRIAALTCIDFVIKEVEKLCAYCMKKYFEENEAEVTSGFMKSTSRCTVAIM